MTAVVRASRARLDAVLAVAGTAPPSVDEPYDFESVPGGFRIGSTRAVVGAGAADFALAEQVVANWEFLPRWLHPYPHGVVPERGQTLVMVANTLGLHWLLPTRVVERIDDADGTRRGFVYVALTGHIAAGYERFVVHYDGATSEVTFDVTAVARPTHPLLRVVPPAFRLLQGYFRHRAMQRARRAVERRRDEAPGEPGASRSN